MFDAQLTCECVFCGTPISPMELGGVTALILIANWDKDEERQHDQQMFCHLSCFKRTMHNPDYLYVEQLLDLDNA